MSKKSIKKKDLSLNRNKRTPILNADNEERKVKISRKINAYAFLKKKQAF